MTEGRTWKSRSVFLGLVVALLPVLARADGKASGKVTDAAGNGIPDVLVRLVPEDPEARSSPTKDMVPKSRGAFTGGPTVLYGAAHGLSVLEARTKKNGNYLFGLVRPGSYRLTAEKEGLRISRIDADRFEPLEREPTWSAHVDVPPGAELPVFGISSASELKFDLKMTPSATGPGAYGTGEPLVAVDEILKMVQDGEYGKADAEILRNLEEKPDSAVWQYLHSYTLFSQGKGEEALPAVDRAIALDPAFEGASLLRGKILEKSGKMEEAAGAFRAETEVAQSKTGLRDAWLALAVVEEQLGRKEGAIAALEKVVEVAPEMTDAYYKLADLYMQAGRMEKVQEVNERLKASGQTEDPNLLFNVGADRFNKGDMKGAAEVFARIVQMKPDYADAWLQLGYAQINQGEKQEAKASLEKYLELRPDGPDAVTARAFLEKISK